MNGLFLIHDNSDIEFNRDLVVAAKDHKQAITLWRAYYGMEKADEPVCVFSFPETVPTFAQVLLWNDKHGMVRVWESKKTFPAI